MDASYLFLPLGILFGIIVSFYDIKHSKTPNFLMWPIILAAIVIHALIIFFSLQGLIFFPMELYKEFILSFIYSSFLVYFLWNLRLISAGDAKIFMVFFFLMLPTIFNFNHVRNFYHITFMQNALLIALIYLIPYVFINSPIKRWGLRLKKVLDWKSVLTIVLFVYAFSFLVQYVLGFLGIRSPTIFLSVIFIFMLLQVFRALFKNKLFGIILVVSVIRLMIEFDMALSFQYWQQTILISVIIILFRFFFMYLGYDLFTKNVRLKDLRPGMMLAEKIAMKKDYGRVQFMKTQDYKRTLIEMLQDRVAPELRAFQQEFDYDPKIGLKKETIDKLKEWRKRGHLQYDSFLVYDSIAFSPYIFIAFLLTILFQGDIVTSILVSLLH